MPNANAFCYGSSAVKIDRPNLVLIEGGARFEASPCDASTDEERRPLAAMIAGVLVVLLLTCVGLFAEGAASSLASSRIGSVPQETHVVRDGESIWSIASQCNLSDVSTKDVVKWIEARNGLDDGLISSGQQLVVPQGPLSGK